MNTTGQRQVWDPLVRIVHWALVVAFTISYLTGEEESAWHIYSGYTVLGLVTFRILWGFVGSKYARFSDFVYRPGTVIAYTRGFLSGHPDYYVGHNPLGGIMVVAILVALIATTFSGLMLYAVEENAGPLAGFAASAENGSPVAQAHADDDDDDDEGEDEGEDEFWEEVHELFVNFTLGLVLIHIAGVLVASRVHRENLIAAMITGKKPVPRDS